MTSRTMAKRVIALAKQPKTLAKQPKTLAKQPKTLAKQPKTLANETLAKSLVGEITAIPVDSSLFSFAMWAALLLPFLVWHLEIFTSTLSFAHKSTPRSFFTRPFENSWNSTFLQNNFLAFSIFANVSRSVFINHLVAYSVVRQYRCNSISV